MDVDVKIYSPAKTVADCFKYRNKIGIDVAIEALRDAWKTRAATADQLWQFARVCRVSNVMRPYLETIAVAPLRTMSPSGNVGAPSVPA